jgi:hypothetical protein
LIAKNLVSPEEKSWMLAEGLKPETIAKLTGLNRIEIEDLR